MKKLYTVEITRSFVVIAESTEEAEDSVRYEREEDEEPDLIAQELRYLPGGWDLNCIPYGTREDDDPDRTIKKWIELGAAPFFPEKE